MNQNLQKYTITILIAFWIGISNATPNEVVIIRHGEKPIPGNNLSCKGLNRSLKLPSVLPEFGKFRQIFVPHLNSKNDTTLQARMFQTATPYAIKYDLNINSNYDKSDFKGVVNAITAESGDILMVWEHQRIPALARAFGASSAPKLWNGKDFDSVWILTFPNNNTKMAQLKISKENIQPSDICNF